MPAIHGPSRPRQRRHYHGGFAAHPGTWTYILVATTLDHLEKRGLNSSCEIAVVISFGLYQKDPRYFELTSLLISIGWSF